MREGRMKVMRVIAVIKPAVVALEVVGTKFSGTVEDSHLSIHHPILVEGLKWAKRYHDSHGCMCLARILRKCREEILANVLGTDSKHRSDAPQLIGQNLHPSIRTCFCDSAVGNPCRKTTVGCMVR